MRWTVICLILLASAASLILIGFWRPAGNTLPDPQLAAFVHGTPPVPIVFTSRSDVASLVAAAPDGAEFVFPGKRLWQAREGRLRLLSTDGTVRELTWQRPLPDGDTLIDVMSPAITFDAAKVVFAGRRGNDNHGHFRLYEVGLDGSGLRQITGGADDEGCTRVPPMRYARSNSDVLLDDTARRRVDYDDLDPAPLPGGGMYFVSSRVPDLGRDHARRATNLWLREADGKMQPRSANRNNDRWPFVTCTGSVIYSHWSRNREVITADRRDIAPWQPGMESATQPTNVWAAMLIDVDGGHFSHAAKTPDPLWRPRMLFNGRMAAMTRFGQLSPEDPPDAGLRMVQIEPGLVANVPSALASNSLPKQDLEAYILGPTHDRQGRLMDLATPSPCPPEHVVFAAAVADSGDGASPGRWSIYLTTDTWSAAPTASNSPMTLLFDDPSLVDAEPVAVYARPDFARDTHLRQLPAPIDKVKLADGSTATGPAMLLEAFSVYHPARREEPGQTTDTGEGPIFVEPPQNSIQTIRIYAAQRDRFDDPQQPRTAGAWRLLLEKPLGANGELHQWVPTDEPTVLAGFDAQGQVVEWTSAARDSAGSQASFFAFAGDHYSGGQPRTTGYCLGCHPGHNTIGWSRSTRPHRERLQGP